ncbi:MerR family transcriptional regulator [Modestobacter sp. VKM Ac-2676]|nr:MerR family transcriptional regulator [Modestobacter sp. VKM Ac-2676]
MDERQMQIGEVAEQTGLSTRTIRFYEESGLVTPSARTQGGFRLYTDRDVSRLQLIRRLKPLDLSLDELRDLLQLLDRLGDRPADEESTGELLDRLGMYRALADQRVSELHARWSGAAAFATHLRQQEEQLRLSREVRR